MQKSDPPDSVGSTRTRKMGVAVEHNQRSTIATGGRSPASSRSTTATNPEQTRRIGSGGWILVLMFVLVASSMVHLWVAGSWNDRAHRTRQASALNVRTTSCKTAVAADFTIQCCAEAASDRIELVAIASDIADLAQSLDGSLATASTVGAMGLPAEKKRIVFESAPRPQGSGKLHVLVTGGAGYIGSHATLRLLEDGHAVTVVDNLVRGNRGALTALQAVAAPHQLRFVLLDLGDVARLTELFLASKFDVVIHFAAMAYVAESYKDPLMYYLNVTTNTRHVLEAMQTAGVTQIVYSSTCATYGNPTLMPITESTPQNPVSPYGSAKLAAERMIQEYVASNAAVSAIILRYFNVIGADPKGRIGEFPTAEIAVKHGRISGACFSAALGKLDSLSIMGSNHKTPDGTCVRDYIHVVDLVHAHVLALKAFRSGEVRVYNVGIGKGYSVREFVNACIKVTGVNITVLEREPRAGDASIVYADPRKVKLELGWVPRFTDLESSLATAWNWTSNHPHTY